ncbi:rod shape-determining protein MreD [bacterium]|nr:rod shape-determining protein MreD [bacterium]
MNILKYGLIFIGLYLLQLTFIPLLVVYGIKPDIILIYVVYLSFKEGRIWGTVSGFLMGLIEDFFGFGFIGLNALTKSFTAFIAHTFPRQILGKHLLQTGIVLFCCGCIHDFLFNLIYSFGAGVSVVDIVFKYAIPTALYTSLLGVLICAIFPKILDFADAV